VKSTYQLGPGLWARLGYRVFDAEGEAVMTDELELECVFGYGVLLPALEHKLEGLSEGEQRSVWLKPAEAFGERDPEEVIEVERSEFPEDVAAGDCFDAEGEGGRRVLLQVLDVSEEAVVLDGNHPLAGQRVRFDVEARAIRPASESELSAAEERLLAAEELGEPLIAPESLLRGRSRRYEMGPEGQGLRADTDSDGSDPD
jgi:FKBP-type peptidyl-prolyl cis-trans isomerase SlyD